MTPTARLMPTALRRTVACSIRQATEPGRILHQLLDGKPKILLSLWHGTPGVGEDDDFQPTRGDGTTLLITGDSPLYTLRQEATPEHTNLFQGIPIWLLQTPVAIPLDRPEQVKVRGYGLMHPLFNTASLDYYDLDGAFQWRQYLFDPRMTTEQAARVNRADQFRQLQDMGAWIDAAQDPAPLWQPPCAKANDEPELPWWQQLIRA